MPLIARLRSVPHKYILCSVTAGSGLERQPRRSRAKRGGKLVRNVSPVWTAGQTDCKDARMQNTKRDAATRCLRQRWSILRPQTCFPEWTGSFPNGGEFRNRHSLTEDIEPARSGSTWQANEPEYPFSGPCYSIQPARDQSTLEEVSAEPSQASIHTCKRAALIGRDALWLHA